MEESLEIFFCFLCFSKLQPDGFLDGFSGTHFGCQITFQESYEHAIVVSGAMSEARACLFRRRSRGSCVEIVKVARSDLAPDLASKPSGARERTRAVTVAILAQGTTSGDALRAALFCLPSVRTPDP